MVSFSKLLKPWSGIANTANIKQLFGTEKSPGLMRNGPSVLFIFRAIFTDPKVPSPIQILHFVLCRNNWRNSRVTIEYHVLDLPPAIYYMPDISLWHRQTNHQNTGQACRFINGSLGENLVLISSFSPIACLMYIKTFLLNGNTRKDPYFIQRSIIPWLLLIRYGNLTNSKYPFFLYGLSTG